MRIISMTIILTLFVNSLFGQCDCDKVDQKNGTFYTLCKPFLTATDSIGEIKLSVSAIEKYRYIEMIISFKSNPQIINGGLTIHTNDGKSWLCVLMQRDLSQADSVQTAFGLFVIMKDEMALMQNNSVKAISYYLADGRRRTVNVTYLPTNLTKQIECLEN